MQLCFLYNIITWWTFDFCTRLNHRSFISFIKKKNLLCNARLNSRKSLMNNHVHSSAHTAAHSSNIVCTAN